MKYIKTYENLDQKYSEKDFTEGTYWRYRNANLDTTMKIVKITKGPYSWSYDDYIIAHIGDNNKIEENRINGDVIKHIIELDIPEKILRPSTKREIEEFDLIYTSNKYNL